METGPGHSIPFRTRQEARVRPAGIGGIDGICGIGGPGRPGRPDVVDARARSASFGLPRIVRDWRTKGREAAQGRPPHGGAVIALGNFDGVHLGHRALLAEVRRVARRLGAPMAVMACEPHPRTFFGREDAPFRLATFADKRRAFGRLGVDWIFAPRFDRRFAELGAQDFVRRVLRDGWRVRHVVVGEDYRFAKGRAGDVDGLAVLLRRAGIGLSVVPPVRRGGEVVSSSRIRALLRLGALEEARALLGEPWSFTVAIRRTGRAESGAGWTLSLGDLLRPAPGWYEAELCGFEAGEDRFVTTDVLSSGRRLLVALAPRDADRPAPGTRFRPPETAFAVLRLHHRRSERTGKPTPCRALAPVSHPPHQWRSPT